MTCPNRDGTLGTRGCHFLFGRLRRICGARKNGSRADRGGKGARFGQNQKRKIHRLLPKLYKHLRRCRVSEKNLYSGGRAPRHCGAVRCHAPGLSGGGKDRAFGRAIKVKPVTVELGLQTVHEQTARYIPPRLSPARF